MKEPVTLPIINSTQYRKLKPYLVIAFFVSYFSMLFFFLPWMVAIILGIPSLLLPKVLSGMSKNIKPSGHLVLNVREIIITKTGTVPRVFPIADVSSLRIIRNATHHQVDTTPNSADSHNNWISFTFQQQEYKFEFGITSREESEKFEAIVYELQETHADFYYASI